MVKVYVDESGNLGKSGKYLVLSALVFNTEKGAQRVKRIVRKEQQLFSKENNLDHIAELKSFSLSFTQRQRIITKITSKADVDIFYFIADKEHVDLLRLGKPRNLVYNYFAKLLIGAILRKYNDDFYIIFDQRSTSVKSMNSLTDYLTISAYTTFGKASKNITIIQRDSKTVANLQAADAVAGTIFRAYNQQNKHFFKILETRIISAEEFPSRNFDGAIKNISCNN